MGRRDAGLNEAFKSSPGVQLGSKPHPKPVQKNESEFLNKGEVVQAPLFSTGKAYLNGPSSRRLE